jgi:hypothetical protein
MTSTYSLHHPLMKMLHGFHLMACITAYLTNKNPEKTVSCQTRENWVWRVVKLHCHLWTRDKEAVVDRALNKVELFLLQVYRRKEKTVLYLILQQSPLTVGVMNRNEFKPVYSSNWCVDCMILSSFADNSLSQIGTSRIYTAVSYQCIERVCACLYVVCSDAVFLAEYVDRARKHRLRWVMTNCSSVYRATHYV